MSKLTCLTNVDIEDSTPASSACDGEEDLRIALRLAYTHLTPSLRLAYAHLTLHCIPVMARFGPPLPFSSDIDPKEQSMWSTSPSTASPSPRLGLLQAWAASGGEEDLLISSLLPRVISDVGRHVRQGAAATTPPELSNPAFQGSNLQYKRTSESTGVPGRSQQPWCVLQSLLCLTKALVVSKQALKNLGAVFELAVRKHLG
eukprot:scaffold67457_cov23-Tisochrysis_lutea.AAC.1